MRRTALLVSRSPQGISSSLGKSFYVKAGEVRGDGLKGDAAKPEPKVSEPSLRSKRLSAGKGQSV
jgi:hypothetical protein